MAWVEGALTLSSSVGGAETNFGLNVPGKSNAVRAAGSEPMFNVDPWQLRSTMEPEGADDYPPTGPPTTAGCRPKESWPGDVLA